MPCDTGTGELTSAFHLTCLPSDLGYATFYTASDGQNMFASWPVL